jgi:hypothetical protein
MRPPGAVPRLPRQASEHLANVVPGDGRDKQRFVASRFGLIQESLLRVVEGTLALVATAGDTKVAKFGHDRAHEWFLLFLDAHRSEVCGWIVRERPGK